MLVFATFTSTARFGAPQSLLRYVRIGRGPFASVRADRQGVIAAFDLDTGELVYSHVLDSPAGFALTDDHVYVASMHGNRISVLDERLDLVDSLGTPVMNDLHSITPSAEGFLVTCCGTDAVTEITPDGVSRWTWLAGEHGFTRTPRGQALCVDHQQDYRDTYVDTRDQSTHCNSALPVRRDGRDTILVTLFQQGWLIEIDKQTGDHRVLVRGMRNPHSVRHYGTGWVVSEARAGAVVLLDENFWITDVIERDFDWIQDTLPVADNRQLIIADANNNRLVHWDIAARHPVREVTYSPDWDVYQVEVASPRWEARLRAAAAAGPVTAGTAQADTARPGTTIS